MQDCSHHYQEKITPWKLFLEFVQSPEGAQWLEDALVVYREHRPAETEVDPKSTL